ncbi:DMT family transporter [Ramlibacter sp. AW1]|uniref:DMT family transporter n=1 Tax=Ramlibacter aurantiacus TaxID=2801330 RepID=A0A937D3P1_9BURK|nr:DMT family transporter [Ramlibacter aurantiacus]MBL0420920.1 DMT family transporter [Ramlibacter aurantiacus]
MNAALTPTNIVVMSLPALLWAGNAVVGRMVAPLVPPLTLNMLRWALSLLVLLPMASWVLRRDSSIWTRWRRYALLGLLSVGLYNSMQYLALHTSTPINVTLVGSSMPIFTVAVGALFFKHHPTRKQLVGAALSTLGVLLVLSHGDLRRLAEVRFVPGDLYMLLATAAFALYSWMLTRTDQDDPALRKDWAAFLLVQVMAGSVWSLLLTVGEWTLGSPAPIQWGWPLAMALVFIVLGPSVLAYRLWGLGVQRVGPNIASLFINLTPVFAALMSAAFLGELPRLHHALAFLLMASGILIASR